MNKICFLIFWAFSLQTALLSAQSNDKPADKPGMAFCAYTNYPCASQRSMDKDCPVMTLESIHSNGLNYFMVWFDAKGVFHRQQFGIGGIKSLTSPQEIDPLRMEAQIPNGTRVVLNGDYYRGNGKVYPGCNVITVLYNKTSSSPYQYKCCWNNKEGEYFEEDLYGAILSIPKD